MALTTKERSARAAEKRRAQGEEVLRLPVRAGTKAALLDLMEKNGIEEMAEAMTRMISNAHKFGPAMFATQRHVIDSAIDADSDKASMEAVGDWKNSGSELRRRFYSSREWKAVCKEAWDRDKGTCQRCLAVYAPPAPGFAVHHIAGVSRFPALRLDLSNLVLLCSECHVFVHSGANISQQFIRQWSLEE